MEQKFQTLYNEKGQSIRTCVEDVAFILRQDPNRRFIRCPLCSKHWWYKWINKGIHKDAGPCPTLRLKKTHCPICKRNKLSRPIYGKTGREVRANREEHMMAYHRKESLNEFGLAWKPRETFTLYQYQKVESKPIEWTGNRNQSNMISSLQKSIVYYTAALVGAVRRMVN